MSIYQAINLPSVTLTSNHISLMAQKIAVETLTLKEVSALFQKALEIAMPKFSNRIEYEEKKVRKARIKGHKWVKTYEDFKGAKLSFYCQFLSTLPSPIVSIGMIHRTTRGLILITVDTSNGGIPVNGFNRNTGWQKWVKIYTVHCCERYVERILKVESPTFQAGCEGIMFADMLGPVRHTATIADGIEEIEFQFQEGQVYGYRDANSKIVSFKTVYSNDMLKGKRLTFMEEWKEPLGQLSELFKWKS